MKTVTIKSKKGNVKTYQVYQSKDGKTFTANLVWLNGEALGFSSYALTGWGEPADTEIAACNNAYNEFVRANFRQNVEKPIYGIGSH